MRKDEFLYLHQLLAVTQRTLAAQGVSAADADADAVAETVSPMAAHASKADHQRAVTSLAADLAAAADETDADRAECDRRRGDREPVGRGIAGEK